MNRSDTDATPPAVYARYLDAVTGVDGAPALSELWEPDGVLEFPYAGSVGTPQRCEGIDEINDYFGGLKLFGPFKIRDMRIRSTGDSSWLAEFHGSSTLLDSGRAYEQDYIVRFEVSARNRLQWMREYWDPTRISASPS